MMGIIFIYILNAILKNIFKRINIKKCTVYLILSTFTCKIKTGKNTASLFLLKCQKEPFYDSSWRWRHHHQCCSLTHLADTGDQAIAVSYDSPTPCWRWRPSPSGTTSHTLLMLRIVVHWCCRSTTLPHLADVVSQCCKSTTLPHLADADVCHHPCCKSTTSHTLLTVIARAGTGVWTDDVSSKGPNPWRVNPSINRWAGLAGPAELKTFEWWAPQFASMHFKISSPNGIARTDVRNVTTNKHTRAPENTHANTHTHARTHIYTHARAKTHAPMDAHTHTHTHGRARTHTHRHARARARTHTHTHTHPPTHTPTGPAWWAPFLTHVPGPPFASP